MFGLIKGLWNSFFEKPTIKILIIGLDGAGKTTLLNKLKNLAGQKCLPFDKITPTVGLNIARIEMGDYYNKILLTISFHKLGDYISLFWDLGGQTILRTIWKKYYPDCHGFIFVIDICDKNKLDEAANAFNEVLNHKDLGNVPFLILLNKTDKGFDITLEDLDEKFALKSHENREFKTEKVSAFQPSNLTDSIVWLNSAVFNYYSKTKLSISQ